MATIGGASLLPPCVGPASIAAVALSAIAMRANTEHGFASVAASRSKQDFWHADDNKPPLRSGDDADGSLLNRRVIKKRHFLMRGDKMSSQQFDQCRLNIDCSVSLLCFNRDLLAVPDAAPDINSTSFEIKVFDVQPKCFPAS